MVPAPVQRFRDAVYLRDGNALHECGSLADGGHRGRVRSLLRRSYIKQVYPARVSADEPTGVYGQCTLHSLLPDRCGYAHQRGTALPGRSHPLGHLLHRVLRNLGKSHRCLCRLFRIPVAAVIGSHDVRFDFRPCCRQYRHGDGGYEHSGESEHLSGER